MKAFTNCMLAMVCLGLLLTTGSPEVGAYVWDGGGADVNWSTAGNWDPDATPPAGSFGTDFEFNLAAGGTSNADTNPYKANSITFGAGAGAFTITGNVDERIRVDNLIVNNSATTQTFSAGVTIRPEGTAEPTINAANGHITFDNTTGRELKLYDKGVIFTGAKNTTVDRPIISTNVTATEVAITKNGDGNLILKKNNTYAGTTIVNDGRLDMKHQKALGSNAAGTTVNDGGTIYLLGGAQNGDITEPLTLNGLGYDASGNKGALQSGASRTYNWTGPVTLATDTQIGTDGGSQINLKGVINGSGGLEKNGSGTLKLSDSSNTFTGDVTINNGKLIADKFAKLLGTGSNINVNSGGTLEVRWATAIQSSQAINLNGGLADMRLNSNSGDWGNDINVSADSRLLVRQLSSSPNDQGFGTVTWTSNATLDIDRQNSNTATFDAFDVTGVDATRIGTAPITVGSIDGQRMFFNEGITTITGAVNLTSLRVGNAGGSLNATVNYDGGTNTLTNTGDFYMGKSANGKGTYAFNLVSGTVDLQRDVFLGQATGSDATINITAGTLTVDGDVSDGNNGASTIKVDGGTLDMTDGNLTVDQLVYRSGNITNVAAARLKGGNGVDLALKIKENVDVNFPVTLQGDLRWENGNDGTGVISGTLDLDGGIRTFETRDGSEDIDLSVTGVISNGGVIKENPGTLELAAINTYTGLTTVTDGTLLVSGSIAGDALVTSGTLAGDGTIGGNVDVQGGSISAGGPVGHLTVLGDYNQTGSLLTEIGGTSQGVDFDWLEIDGVADIGGTVDISLLDPFAPTMTDTFDILTAAGGINESGFQLSWDSSQLLPAQYWTYSVIDLGGGAQALRLSIAVPEPSTMLLGMFGLIGFIGSRLLRRSKKRVGSLE